MQAAEGQPLLEGPIADRWRTLSEEVQRARHAGLASDGKCILSSNVPFP